MFHKLIAAFFTWYISRIIKSDFSSFQFNSLSFQDNRSILLIANHFSWWDGFLLFELNRKLFKKNFHVMVTEENYKEVFFLKHLGAFPIKRASKSIVETLNYAGKLLDNPDNLVLIFPQGKLYSNHVDDVLFEKGLMSVIKASTKEFQYVFAATFADFFDRRKASIKCYLQIWQSAGFINLEVLKGAYNQHYHASRQQQNHITV